MHSEIFLNQKYAWFLNIVLARKSCNVVCALVRIYVCVCVCVCVCVRVRACMRVCNSYIRTKNIIIYIAIIT